MTGVASLIRRSPLDATSPEAVVVASGPGVEIVERPFLAQVLLRMPPSAAGAAAGRDVVNVGLPEVNRLTASDRGFPLVLWLGPDEWLILDESYPAALVARIAGGSAPHGGVVVDVSAHRTWLELRGPGTVEVLSAGCSVDLHPRMFDVGSAAQTQLARVDVILGRRAPEIYLVAVRASFARYLLQWLSVALEGLEGEHA